MGIIVWWTWRIFCCRSLTEAIPKRRASHLYQKYDTWRGLAWFLPNLSRMTLVTHSFIYYCGLCFQDNGGFFCSSTIGKNPQKNKVFGYSMEKEVWTNHLKKKGNSATTTNIKLLIYCYFEPKKVLLQDLFSREGQSVSQKCILKKE